MVKRIPKHLVRKGMFVEALECPTAEFAERRFLIQSDETLRAVHATSADYALVNTKKSTVGLDREKGTPPVKQAEQRKTTIATITRATTSLRHCFDVALHGRLEVESLGPIADQIAERMEASAEIFLEVTRLKSKDESSYVHSVTVSGLMMRLARMLDYGNETVMKLGVAGLLHDIGKISIPNAVLNKTEKLDEQEMNLIRTHPERGYNLLKEQAGICDLTLTICRHHHELLDGSGYPLGLAGGELGPEIRISTVCDVFEALTSVRPYKRAWSKSDALNWMFDRGHLFDKKLVIRLGSMFA
jgi:putative nucleotidyltransferase with HDIG domain